jgi:hypothetical protein
MTVNPFFTEPRDWYWLAGVRLPWRSVLLVKISKGTFWYNKTEEGDKRYSLIRLGWETNTAQGWTIYCATLLWLSIQLGVYNNE